MTLVQVPRAQKASWKTFGLLLYRIGLLFVWTVFSLPGVILHAPIFITASVVSKIKAKGNVVSSCHAVPQVLMCLQRLLPRRS
jgi:glycerol-3-phosphate O-acyltransferase/dihydroxyacetone phosphate acyltransferase